VEVQAAGSMARIVLLAIRAVFRLVWRLRPDARGDARSVLECLGKADRPEGQPAGAQKVGAKMGAQEGKRIGRVHLCAWSQRAWGYPEEPCMTRLPYPNTERIPDLTPDEFRELEAAGQIVRREEWRSG